jgi:hypothetical protein
MHSLRSERRSPGRLPLSQDIAEHIYANAPYGGVAIVAKQPARMHAAVRKQWYALVRVAGMPASVQRTQQLHFSADLLHNPIQADVMIATAEEFLLAPPMCHIMYVTYVIDNLQLRQITGFMSPGALVVLYEEPRDA